MDESNLSPEDRQRLRLRAIGKAQTRLAQKHPEEYERLRRRIYRQELEKALEAKGA